MGNPDNKGGDEDTRTFGGLDALQKREGLENVLAKSTINLIGIFYGYYGAEPMNEFFINAFSARLYEKLFRVKRGGYDLRNVMQCDITSVDVIKELTYEKVTELFKSIEDQIYDVFMGKMHLRFMDLKKDGLTAEKARDLLAEIDHLALFLPPSDQNSAKKMSDKVHEYFEQKFGEPASTAQEVENVIDITGKFHLVPVEPKTAQESQEPPVSQEPTPPQESEPPAELQVQEPPPPGKLENLLADLENEVNNASDRKTAEQHLKEAYDIRLIMIDSPKADSAVLKVEKIFRKKFGDLPNPDRESLCLTLGFCNIAAEKETNPTKQKDFLKKAFTQSEMILDSKIKEFAISCMEMMADHLGIDMRDITEQKPVIEDVDDYVETVDEDLDNTHSGNPVSRITEWVRRRHRRTIAAIATIAVAATLATTLAIIDREWHSKQKPTATQSLKTPESSDKKESAPVVPTPSLEQEAKSLASAIVYLTQKSGGLPENSVKLLRDMAEDFDYKLGVLLDDMEVLKNVYMEVEVDSNGNLVTKGVDFGKSGFTDIKFERVFSAQRHDYLIWNASLKSGDSSVPVEIFIPKGQLSDVAKAGKYPVFAVAAREYYPGYKER